MKPSSYAYEALFHYAYDTLFHYAYDTLFHYAYDAQPGPFHIGRGLSGILCIEYLYWLSVLFHWFILFMLQSLFYMLSHCFWCYSYLLFQSTILKSHVWLLVTIAIFNYDCSYYHDS